MNIAYNVEAEKIVERLLLQYREYLHLTESIQKLEGEKFSRLATMAKKHGVPIAEIKKNEAAYPEIHTLNQLVSLLVIDRDQTSGEMTFASPLIWIMYKEKAYQGTPNEIPHWKAFKEHCAPEGYICTKRFRFIERYTHDTRHAFVFPDSTTLSEVCASDTITNLLSDAKFMTEWKKQEYHRTGGLINKWDSVPS